MASMSQNWIWVVVIIIVLIILFFLLWQSYHQPQPQTSNQDFMNLATMVPPNHIDRFMERHHHIKTLDRLLHLNAFLVREYMIAITARSAATSLCAGQVGDRLSNNLVELGQTLAYFTNAEVGNRFTTLIKDHAKQLENVVVMIKNKQNADNEIASLHDQDRKIAHFLAMEIGGDEVKLTKDLVDHTDSTIREATAIINGQCMGSLTAFESDVMNSVNNLSDHMAQALLARKY